MERRRIIRTDIAASAVVHLSLVALIILISEVHPFRTPPSDTVAVDIVTPEELKKEQEKVPEPAPIPTPTPTPELRLPEFTAKEKEATSKTPATASPEPQTAQQQPAPKRSPQASPPPPRRDVDAQPQPQPPPQPQATPQPPAPSYRPPEPDVTVKYGVMLGLPETPSPLPSSTKDAPKDDVGGAQDTVAAKLSTDVIAELYRHLRSCAKPPAEISRSDKVHIKLRAFMTTDGRLATAPALIEASASPAKGLAMLESARSALEACQPYTMLPADKYREWRVLDLTFTPKDLGAS
jgi:hypothetical protein